MDAQGVGVGGQSEEQSRGTRADHDTVKLRSDNNDRRKHGALHGSHNTVLPYRVKVCFYCMTSLAVLSSGSAVGVRADALFLFYSLHGVCVVGFFRCKQAI